MDQGSFPTDSAQGGSDIDPGSMGQMASSASSGGYGGGGDEYGESGFEEELPLLVELGIDFNMIKQKVCFEWLHILVLLSVLYIELFIMFCM